MNLVEQVARMIDSEGAYGIAYPDSSGTSSPIPFSIRQKYFQAKYECLAIDIIKRLMAARHAEMRTDLIAWEKDGWRRLGVPIGDPKFKEDADRIIDAKYPIPTLPPDTGG